MMAEQSLFLFIWLPAGKRLPGYRRLLLGFRIYLRLAVSVGNGVSVRGGWVAAGCGRGIEAGESVVAGAHAVIKRQVMSKPVINQKKSGIGPSGKYGLNRVSPRFQSDYTLF